MRPNVQAPAGRFVLCLADPSEVDWVAIQEAQVYSEDDAIPFEILREWFAANPNVVRGGMGSYLKI